MEDKWIVGPYLPKGLFLMEYLFQTKLHVYSHEKEIMWLVIFDVTPPPFIVSFYLKKD